MVIPSIFTRYAACSKFVLILGLRIQMEKRKICEVNLLAVLAVGLSHFRICIPAWRDFMCFLTAKPTRKQCVPDFVRLETNFLARPTEHEGCQSQFLRVVKWPMLMFCIRWILEISGVWRNIIVMAFPCGGMRFEEFVTVCYAAVCQRFSFEDE